MHFLFCFYIFLSLPLRRVSARGCFAGDSSRAFGFHAPNGKLPYRPVTFDLTAALPLLSSETPGVAIWSCFVAPDRASAAELVAPLLCAPDYLYCSESNRNFVYFDLFTHAAAALLKLSRREGLDMRALHGDFERLFSDETVIRRVTDAPPDSPIYIEIADFQKYLLRMTAR